MSPEDFFAAMSQKQQPAPQVLQGPPQISMDLPPDELRRRSEELERWMAHQRQLPPAKPDRVGRQMLVQSQYASHDSSKERAGNGEVQLRMTIGGFEGHSSKNPLKDLSPIPLEELLVRKIHTGRYLLCRTIAPCVRTVGIQAVVEDQAGAAQTLAIYNYPTSEGSTPDYVDEPATQGPHPIIRVDSPSDIVFLDPSSPYLQGVEWRSGFSPPSSPLISRTPEGWKSLGNTYFQSGKWLLAARAYSRGLIMDPTVFLLHLNRAEAYLRLGYYSAAIADAEHVLSVPNVPQASRDKATFRLGKALYFMRDYLGAEERFKVWVSTHPGEADGSGWLARSQSRYRESQTGEYDWVELFRQHKKTDLDAAEYTGPVEVKALSSYGGGRGVVATREVKVGELLVVAKPFAAAFPDCTNQKELFMSLNMHTKAMETHSQTVLVSRVIETIYGNPQLYPQVRDLYAGPNAESPPSSYPPKKAPVFGLMSPDSVGVDIDADLMQAICTYNSFTPSRESPIGESDGTAKRKDMETPSALYLLPSLFNHACLSNAGWHCIGDVMAIRAMANIGAGEEITLPYCWNPSLSKRQEHLKKHLPQGCSCSFCQQERSDGDAILAQRDTLAETLGDEAVARMSLAQRRSLVEEVTVVYPASQESQGRVKPLLAKAHSAVGRKLFLAAVQHLERDLKASIDEFIKALEASGINIPKKQTKKNRKQTKSHLAISTDRVPVDYDRCIMEMSMIAACFVRLGEEDDAIPWLRAGSWLCDAVLGGGKELFLLKYSSLLERQGLREIATKSL
ncbi:hypothetical protein JAAARDRAFT_204949 [Jaapia argillacea MUCL 33604]|uniref:SET domain-containing protein n=1 Tax=Jaapia argillacea MUCL 33604 TaxID=933084 RepID=A0A067Q2B5_9AGAM|nr:hypothetical protein JAAARDRAFT_204949 [Jaapia argillacea MUCL 33604]